MAVDVENVESVARRYAVLHPHPHLDEPQRRVRAPGGGRKKLAATDPDLLVQLKALVDPVTRGDPMLLLMWTTKSTRNLADALTTMGHAVSDRTVARMLQELGFSLQSNTKALEGRQHEDRDAQFHYLANQVAAHVTAGAPVISVDAKKKELVGQFTNGGREYQPAGQPERVNDHDFPDKDLGKAIPYGIYGVSANTGWVSVGTDHDTSAFAVQTLRRWWDTIGKPRYSDATMLLICADGGGSNGHRIRAWKIELAQFTADTGLQITMNWRGRALKTHQIIVDLINSTTTADVEALPLTRHEFHGEWNYTLTPPDTP